MRRLIAKRCVSECWVGQAGDFKRSLSGFRDGKVQPSEKRGARIPPSEISDADTTAKKTGSGVKAAGLQAEVRGDCLARRSSVEPAQELYNLLALRGGLCVSARWYVISMLSSLEITVAHNGQSIQEST